MQEAFTVERDKPVIGEEIESLRVAVGWDKFEGKYNYIQNKMYTHYTVRSNKSLIGFLNILSDGIGDAFLIDLMVHPDFQKKGIGSALVKKAIVDLKSEGIKCVQVTFCQPLEAFFKKFGFHICKAGIIDNDKMEVSL